MKSLACMGILFLLARLAHPATPPVRLASPETDALQLVRLLHLDQMLSQIINQDAQQAFAAGRVTEAQLGCLHATPADFTERLAGVARAELTPAELSSALVYLRSSDGRKVETMLAESTADSTAPLDLTSSEVAASAAFRESPAGKKLVETSLLMKTAGMDDLAADYSRLVKAKCQLTQPLQPPDDPRRELH